MAIPQWNSEWEKPDPLRGAQGWSWHHYATVGAAVLLLVTAFSVLVPAVPKTRDQERDLDRASEQLIKAMSRSSGISAYDRAAVAIGTAKKVVLPHGAVVHRTSETGAVWLFMKKTLSFYGHPPESMSIRDVRKNMGCAVKT